MGSNFGYHSAWELLVGFGRQGCMDAKHPAAYRVWPQIMVIFPILNISNTVAEKNLDVTKGLGGYQKPQPIENFNCALIGRY